MNVDQRSCGSSWRLPSPSSTPPSASFTVSTFETPRPDVITSSHFADAYRTPQLHGNETPAPKFLDTGFPSIPRPSTSSSVDLANPAFHVNYHTTNPHLLLPPVEPSQRLSSSPDLASAAWTPTARTTSPTVASRSSADKNMDSSQMQTPPPTRDSSSKRKAQQTALQFGTPSTIIQKKVLSTPGVPAPVPSDGFATFSTPLQFPGLQFSPDAFQFPVDGSSSAPALPHSRFVWDTPGASDAGMIFSDDPFATPSNLGAAQNWFATPRLPDNKASFVDFTPQASSPPGPAYWSDATQGRNSDGVQQPPNFMSTSGVDPNMLFSFTHPSQALNNSFVEPQRRHSSFDPSALEKSMNQQAELQPAQQPHSRGSSGSSTFSGPNGPRPGLQRSNTDSGSKKPANSSLTRSTSFGHIPRRPSPLKRNNYGPLSAIPEAARPRPRTRLVIGKDGRARTETRDSTSPHDPAKRYPELWDDDSDTEPEEDLPVLSRHTSFNLSFDSKRPTKQARMNSYAKQLDSAGLPRPSSVGSNHEQLPSSRAGSSGRESQKAAPRHKLEEPRRYSMPAFASLDISKIGENEDDNAQGALERMVKSRITRTQQEKAKAALVRSHNARWAQHPSGPSKKGSPSIPSESDTPTTERSSTSNEETRCVCASVEGDGLEMIQCESCMKWLHTRCVGLNTRHIPPVYVCVFCTGQTPVVRGGRLREHRTSNTFASPLGHKGSYRR